MVAKTAMDAVPDYVEQGFRWIRETIALVYAHHQHPLPMTALIFMYAETLGETICDEKGVGTSTENKVCAFVENYMPKLWNALGNRADRQKVLGNVYRNGLVHQMFMKRGYAIHEDKTGLGTKYVVFHVAFFPMSINIDRLVPEFLDGLATYYERLTHDAQFLKLFIEIMTKP